MTRFTPFPAKAAMILALAVAAWAARPAFGQTMATTATTGESSADSDTLYFGQRAQTQQPKLYFGPIHGDLTLEYIYDHTHTSSSVTDSHESESMFQETLSLYTNGYIIHPNIVDLNLGVTGGLNQQHFETDDQSGNSNGTVYGWDVSATFFRNQPGNLTLYSRRNQTTQDIPFGPTQEITTTETGARLSYATAETNAQFNAYHQEDDQSALTLNGPDFKQTRDVVNGYGSWRPASNQTLNWSFGLERNEFDSGGTTTSQDTQTASLSHTLMFGEGNRHTLTSSLGYTNMSGSLEQEDLRWLENLHLWHTRNLESNYTYSYDQQTFGSDTTTQQFASADLRHQLYNSLYSTARVSWQDVSSDSNSFQIYTATLNESYQKQVPYGILHADLSLGWEKQIIDGTGPVEVTNQPTAFVGIDPITVSQPNAVPSSVILRDATTGRVYQQGTDYTVGSNPLGLTIDRTLGGNILPGQPLLMNYAYDPLNVDEITTNSLGLGTRYEITKGPLAGLTPYARFFGQNQQVSGGTADSNDVREYVLGVNYDIQELSLMVEREWYDSTLYPFDLWRAQARWNHNVTDNTQFAATASYTKTDYHDPGSHTDAYSLNAVLSHRLTLHLTGNVYATYTEANSDPGGKTTGMEEGIQIDWNYRDTHVYARIRNSTLNSDTSDRDFQFVQIGLTRKF